jgi:hypothetical protein
VIVSAVNPLSFRPLVRVPSWVLRPGAVISQPMEFDTSHRDRGIRDVRGAARDPTGRLRRSDANRSQSRESGPVTEGRQPGGVVWGMARFDHRSVDRRTFPHHLLRCAETGIGCETGADRYVSLLRACPHCARSALRQGPRCSRPCTVLIVGVLVAAPHWPATRRYSPAICTPGRSLPACLPRADRCGVASHTRSELQQRWHRPRATSTSKSRVPDRVHLPG